MTSTILSFNWMTFLMVAVTFFWVINNRAFSKKMRINFQIVLAVCLYLSVLSQHLNNAYLANNGFLRELVYISDLILRPVAVVMLIYVFIKLKRGRIDYIFTTVFVLIFAASLASEAVLHDGTIVNNTLCVIACIVYYYCVMETYKKDNLTRLPLRHNLNYEMEDIANRDYDVVLIDVDNFKLINDKYGHEKGDEALVSVVNAINKKLLKGCRLYRYGGDEFVIISRKITREELAASLDAANLLLKESDLHFSYGIDTHKAGEDGNIAIAKADEKMYDNKKELKGDGIWDSMTGLFNYRGLLAELAGFRKIVEKEDHSVRLVSVDIERLNSINMAYGYIEGNYVIKTLSKILEAAVMGDGFVGHLNSDEFVAVLEAVDENDSVAADYIERISEAVENAVEFADKDYTIRLNIGEYFVEKDSRALAEEIINGVLYVKQEVKDNKNKSEALDADQDYNPEEERLVMEILDNNKLRYAFQPIVSAKDGEIVAYESLMRSNTEQMISPLAILKYAERNKRSYEIEKYTFFNVFERITSANDFSQDKRIFINSIPGFMLLDEDYDSLKNKYGDLFECMVIEITEQREVDDNALATINVRRDMDGFNLAIDDYGSGYSNTNSLLRYMPQIIKLDRLLITGIERNAKKQFFVDSIISFARENDMKILAEGVETESELKTLIRLGVDMIQGYYTAKPAFEIIESIPEDIKKVIIEENIKVGGSNKRMVYTATDNCEISSVRLAMEDYSKINVSSEFITIVGNTEYTADLVIKIKDGTNCHMTLSDVRLNSVDDEPCIEIGEGANLVLNLEGKNRLNAKGIHVPEGSSLTVIGMGDLEITTKGHECYAIGADSESGFGKIELNSSGLVNILVDGENCVGIGGGIASDKSGLILTSGTFDMRVAGVDAVGVGSYNGNVPIKIQDCKLNVDFRVNRGIVIGMLNGNQDIDIKGFSVNIVGSGTAVSGIGSINDTSGRIRFEAGAYRVKLNGQRLYLLGTSAGELDIKSSHVKFEMVGEGDNVLGFGSFDKKSHVSVDESSLELVINASNPLGMGIVEDDTEIGFRGALTTVKINGETRVLGEGK